MSILLQNDILMISRKGRFWSRIGLLIISSVCITGIVFFSISIFRSGGNQSSILLLCLIICALAVLLIRALYFSTIDTDVEIIKEGSSFHINGVLLLKASVDCIFITEYTNPIRDNTCNVYLKLHDKRKVPIAIRINAILSREVERLLKEFTGIEKIEKKKYLMNI